MNEEELQELEELRREKHQRAQQSRAEQLLQEAGISGSFAALLAGSGDEDTEERTRRFCETYQSALAEDIRARLPKEAPTVSDAAPKRVRRGIQRL